MYVVEQPLLRKGMKIAVLRARGLSGLLGAVPVFRALDAAFPDASIALIGLPRARGFAARLHRYLDEFAEFPGFPGMPERELQDLPGFFGALRARGFDLALQLHDSGRFANPFVALLQAKACAGFYEPGAYCPDPSRYLPWRPDEDDVPRDLRLLAHLGVPSRGTYLEFPLADADWRELKGFGLREGRYAVIHPGAPPAAQGWPPERFAEVADELAMDGLNVVLTGASSERNLSARVKASMRQPALDLAGRTSLGGFAALLGRARLLVSADTGACRLAGAMRTAGVVVPRGPDASVHDVLHEVHMLAERAA